MKAILTHKGARRYGLHSMGNKIVDVADLRTMPWGSRNVTVLVNGKIVARSAQVYTPGHGKDCGLILLAS
jgi:hypothetical protein